MTSKDIQMILVCFTKFQFITPILNGTYSLSNFNLAHSKKLTYKSLTFYTLLYFYIILITIP
jgi:hypothetical protein